MYIGILRESAPGERRVAVTPEIVAQFVKAGHRTGVVSGAGGPAHLDDDRYRAEGAEIFPDPGSLAREADVVVAVRCPEGEVLEALRPGLAVVGMLGPLARPGPVEALAERGLTAFSLDTMPRVTRAQDMDVLSAMSTVAGYRAVILAAEASRRFFPLLMTAAGTVTPAKVLVIGAGVAGLQAISVARRLGAVVQGFDARPAVREQVESLGARFLALPDLEAEGSGGYARAIGADEEAREQAFLEGPVAAADIVIATAMVPGRPAPRLITEAMVAAMRPGSVIIDLAAEAGGNTAVTVPGKRITARGVVVEGATDLPSQMPLPASQLLSRVTFNYVRYLVGCGLSAGEDRTVRLPADSDEIVTATLIASGGHVVHGPTLARLRDVSGSVRPQGGRVL